MIYKAVFIDSNYYCALFNREDALHNKARKLKINLESSHTSNFVLLESYTVISQRSGRKQAVYFGEHMHNQYQTNVLLVSPEVEQLSWDIFKKIKNKNMSYVDCSILALIKLNNIKTLLSFDNHFKNYQSEFNFKLLQ